MDKEIEVKLKYKNKKDLIKKLKELGAKKKENILLEDTYFGAPGANMSNKNSITRVRIKNSESELTYKGQCKDKNNVWERTEITAKIENSEQMKLILQNLGLEKISENKSIREVWILDKCEIVFIDFVKPDKISILEIEGPTEKKVHEIIKKLGTLVDKIGEEAFRKFDEARK